jgi:hypothetical protein
MDILNKIFPLKKIPVATDTPQPADKADLSDILAPREIEIDFSHIKINEMYYRSFFVSAYPRYIEPNWLEPLINFDHTLDFTRPRQRRS